jgi:hypothetical protein
MSTPDAFDRAARELEKIEREGDAFVVTFGLRGAERVSVSPGWVAIERDTPDGEPRDIIDGKVTGRYVGARWVGPGEGPRALYIEPRWTGDVEFEPYSDEAYDDADEIAVPVEFPSGVVPVTQDGRVDRTRAIVDAAKNLTKAMDVRESPRGSVSYNLTIEGGLRPDAEDALLALIRAMALPAPTWTSTPPSEPGFYWARISINGWNHTAVCSIGSDGAPNFPGEMRVHARSMPECVQWWHGRIALPGE